MAKLKEIEFFMFEFRHYILNLVRERYISIINIEYKIIMIIVIMKIILKKF